MKKLALLCVLSSLPAFGQEQVIQRELLMRQQQSDAFALQLRQSQQLQAIPAGRRAEVETLQLLQRQDLDNLSARQLNEAARDKPAESRLYDRSRFDSERRLILAFPEPVRRFEEPPRRNISPTFGPGSFEIRAP